MNNPFAPAMLLLVTQPSRERLYAQYGDCISYLAGPKYGVVLLDSRRKALRGQKAKRRLSDPRLHATLEAAGVRVHTANYVGHPCVHCPNILTRATNLCHLLTKDCLLLERLPSLGPSPTP